MALGVGVASVWWAVAAAEAVLGAATIVWLVRRGRQPGPSAFLDWSHRGRGWRGCRGDGDWIWTGGVGQQCGPSLALFLPDVAAPGSGLSRLGSGGVEMDTDRPLHRLSPGLSTQYGCGNGAAPRALSRPSSGSRSTCAGIPDDALIRTHFPSTRNDGQQERAHWAIPMLREARIGPFAPAGEDSSRLWWVAVEVLVAVVAVRWLWNLGRAVQSERARELFRLQHERFEEQLLAAAAATGLPRGLRWVSCSIVGDAVLVRDAADAGIVALVPVVLQFEPIEGSDMEHVAAAHEPRPATAVFTLRAAPGRPLAASSSITPPSRQSRSSHRATASFTTANIDCFTRPRCPRIVPCNGSPPHNREIIMPTGGAVKVLGFSGSLRSGSFNSATLARLGSRAEWNDH